MNQQREKTCSWEKKHFLGGWGGVGLDFFQISGGGIDQEAGGGAYQHSF